MQCKVAAPVGRRKSRDTNFEKRAVSIFHAYEENIIGANSHPSLVPRSSSQTSATGQAGKADIRRRLHAGPKLPRTRDRRKIRPSGMAGERERGFRTGQGGSLWLSKDEQRLHWHGSKISRQNMCRLPRRILLGSGLAVAILVKGGAGRTAKFHARSLARLFRRWVLTLLCRHFSFPRWRSFLRRLSGLQEVVRAESPLLTREAGPFFKPSNRLAHFGTWLACDSQ